MNLELMGWLKKEFAEQYVSADDVFRKSLCTTAVPAMGSTKATLWIILDNVRGEDLVRRHYEAMLRFDGEIDGKEHNIDPYGGPRELALRLRAQGYNIEFTILPADFANKVKYCELKLKQFRVEHRDIQAVCYNLEHRVMPTEEMEKQA